MSVPRNPWRKRRKRLYLPIRRSLYPVLYIARTMPKYFLVIMIFIPPVLRLIVPNTIEEESSKKEPSKVTPQIVSNELKCDLNQSLGDKSITFNVSTSYYDKNITSIIFTYDFSLLQDLDIPSDLALFNDLNELKNITGVEYNKNGNEESVAIYSTTIISTEPKLEKYRQSIEAQKAYYEQLGLTCEVFTN